MAVVRSFNTLEASLSAGGVSWCKMDSTVDLRVMDMSETRGPRETVVLLNPVSIDYKSVDRHFYSIDYTQTNC